MPKEKIAFISLLKPVDDIRSYRKMARSLSSMTGCEIHLFGYPSKSTLTDECNIFFHPQRTFRRLGLIRFFIPLIILRSLIKLKPKLIIVNSHELLIVTIINQILFGTRIVYDIQENYYYNLWYQQVYPPILRHLMAIMIRCKERLLAPFFDHFFLAEKCYQEELSFVQSRSILIENKALPLSKIYPRSANKTNTTTLLFSGTITQNTGIDKALELTKSLQTMGDFELLVTGHCPVPALYNRLNKMEAPWLRLNISQTPLPYTVIEQAIVTADIGLICYQLNPSNQRCMPTKVYEYAAQGLPMLYEKDTHWETFIEEHAKGAVIDFKSKNEVALNDVLIQVQEFKSKERKTCDAAMWIHEEQSFLSLMQSLLS
ncbi:hypothetical protein N6H18_14365 [Reichenbachiella agarivorans]|uniref:Uncharacterized protein n=1 Tax=Reichenbachiella agarivorans TaxID=2979464 RepID=A0ABY6CM00_9BACT|nr:hypothetical protein [Reichenbachiella agarivorans]UXP31532.1 hypothetical protein N6H18_14365 [Reichenbachiella agarivorans]